MTMGRFMVGAGVCAFLCLIGTGVSYSVGYPTVAGVLGMVTVVVAVSVPIVAALTTVWDSGPHEG